MDACVEKGCKDKSFNTDGFVAHAKQDFIYLKGYSKKREAREWHSQVL